MECVVLKEFNSIPMRSLAAEQTADVSKAQIESRLTGQMIKIAAKAPQDRMQMSKSVLTQSSLS